MTRQAKQHRRSENRPAALDSRQVSIHAAGRCSIILRGRRVDLSPRQVQFIRAFVAHRDQYQCPPTIRELGEALAIRSPNGVQGHVNALKTKGVLADDQNLTNKSRCLRIAEGVDLSPLYSRWGEADVRDACQDGERSASKAEPSGCASPAAQHLLDSLRCEIAEAYQEANAIFDDRSANANGMAWRETALQLVAVVGRLVQAANLDIHEANRRAYVRCEDGVLASGARLPDARPAASEVFGSASDGDTEGSPSDV